MLRLILILLVVGSFFLPTSSKKTPVLTNSAFDKSSNLLLAASPKRKKVIERIQTSTVSIEVELSEGEFSSIIGTGVYLLDKNFGHVILTAEHVSLASLKGKIKFCSIVSEDCITMSNRPFLEADTGNLASDWAIYLIDKPPKGMNPAVTDNESVDLGESVWLIGHQRGMQSWISHGNIASIYEHSEEKNYVLYGVHSFAAPGFSGGGVFTSKGQLIGITVAIHVDSKTGAPQGGSALVVPLGNISLLKLSLPAPTGKKLENDQ